MDLRKIYNEEDLFMREIASYEMRDYGLLLLIGLVFAPIVGLLVMF